MANYGSYVKKTASCPLFGDWAIANKLTVKWGNAKRGDIVLFDFNNNGTSDHIGIVTKVGDGYIETIEGNTGYQKIDGKKVPSNTNGDGVYRRKRYKKDVNYFVRTKCPNIEAVIKTAESQLGYKEGRNNSNKYGKWFGYNNVAWCCEFVVWCFYHTTAKATTSEPTEVKPIKKPTGKYSGTIPKPTLIKGSEGNDVKLWQKFLNWYGEFDLVLDGDFGEKTEHAQKVFQKTEGLKVTGNFGEGSYTHALAYKEVKKSNADKIGDKAIELSWKSGTPSAIHGYKYSKNKKWSSWKQLGKATPNDAFIKAFSDVFPEHWGFGSAKYGYGGRVGASCDKFVGCVVRASGVDKAFPHTLDEMNKGTPSKFKKVDTGGKVANMEHGDVVVYHGHTLIVVVIKGKKYFAQAGLNHNFGYRTKATSLAKKSNLRVWRAK